MSKIMMPSQSTSEILMIRPSFFGFNEDAAATNEFQKKESGRPAEEISRKALKEFDCFASLLQEAGVNVNIVEENIKPASPDSIFPNNWISFHENGKAFIYPMCYPNRRMERNIPVLETLKERYPAWELIDLTYLEKENKFLEGTGSMVLDRVNKIAYACISPRTHPQALSVFCSIAGYRPLMFHAAGTGGKAIYHTNVMMAIGENLAVLCDGSIADPEERRQVIGSLQSTGKEILFITPQQMSSFAGNMLQVNNKKGRNIWLLSSQALNSLTPEQRKMLERNSFLIAPEIHTIESSGGGSVRCMLAEIFAKQREAGS